MLAEFRAFLVGINALALAVGVVIGTALGTVVTSLVTDIIMPPIGLVLGGVDFSSLAINLKEDGNVAIRYGAFLNTVLAFVVVAFVVWQIGRVFITPAPQPEPVEMKACPYCVEQVPAAATKCRACASQL